MGKLYFHMARIYEDTSIDLSGSSARLATGNLFNAKQLAARVLLQQFHTGKAIPARPIIRLTRSKIIYPCLSMT